ncbi:MAG: flagellar basal body L-ring protein [Ignavibacteriae bacterium HGW-Ignavibacteriae-4]|jgi:flagellar L-ring protein precursor FlgH|nr:MAG: flagellar basal body L-ring protein [Ignavibacteriae bacterium HGW-Ignavibacteriae-4]
MKSLIIAIVFLSAFGLQAQFVQNSSNSLFSDFKAFRKGDALTVLIVEDTKAGNSATTKNGRESSVGAGFGVSAGSGSSSGDVSLGTSTDFNGDGSTSRNESIRSKLSARVVDLEDNGNLIIEGKRTTKVNGETQYVTIKGVVRPVDVRPDNSVYSYSILDLTLLIDGDGTVSEYQEPGLITKFLRILF